MPDVMATTGNAACHPVAALLASMASPCLAAGLSSRAARAAAADVLAVVTGLRSCAMLDQGFVGAACAGSMVDVARTGVRAVSRSGDASETDESKASLAHPGVVVAVMGGCTYVIRPDLLADPSAVLLLCLPDCVWLHPPSRPAAQFWALKEFFVRLSRPGKTLFARIDLGRDPSVGSGRRAAEAFTQVKSRQKRRAGGHLAAADAALDAPLLRSSLTLPTASGYLLGYPVVYAVESLAQAEAASRQLSGASVVASSVEARLHCLAGPSSQLGPCATEQSYCVPAVAAEDAAARAAHRAWIRVLADRARRSAFECGDGAACAWRVQAARRSETTTPAVTL